MIIALTAVNCDRTISGLVRTPDGKGIDKVQIIFLTQDSTKAGVSSFLTETDTMGYYKQEMRTGWKFWEGWSGTITPFKENFEFTSEFSAYSNVRGDRTKENFIGMTTPPPSRVPQVPFSPTWSTTFALPTETFQAGFEVEAGFDLDKDRKKEFAVFDSESSKLTLCEATGDNAFAVVWSYKLSGLAGKRASIMVGDLDGDDREELILLADTPAGQPAIFVWESKGGIANLPRNPTSAFQPPRDQNGRIKPSTACVADDFDNDGKDELAILYTGGADVLMAILSVEIKPADDSWSWNIEFIDRNAGDRRAAGLGVRDIDRDGDKEIVVVCEGEKAPIRLYSSSDGSFRVVKEWSGRAFPADYRGSSANIPIEDFNGDGSWEAYVYSNGRKADVGGSQPVAARVWVVALDSYLPNAFNKKNWAPIATLGATSLRGGVTGDGDSDGKPDLYAAGTETGVIYQIEYTGGTIEDPVRNIEDASRKDSIIADSSKYAPYIIAKDSPSGSLAPTNISSVGDLDGDGFAEYLIVRGANNPGASTNGAFVLAQDGSAGSNQEINQRPPAPTHLVIKRIASNEAELSWKDNAENEDSFLIYRDASLPVGMVKKDVRHFVDLSAPATGKYFVLAANNACKDPNTCDLSNIASIPTTTATEKYVTHSNSQGMTMTIGNQAGAGIGWSDLVISEQDVLYRGYLLIRSAPTTGSSSTVYSGNVPGDFTNPTPILLGTESTSGSNPVSYQYTAQSSSSKQPVTFQVNGAGLTIEQTTVHKIGTQWILCCWKINNTSASAQQVKLALHLDADAGGENSVFDVSNWNGTMIYQKKHGGDSTVGIALIEGQLGGYYVNTFGQFDAATVLNMNNPNVFSTNAADLEMTLIGNLGSIPAKSQSARAIFAIAAGNNLDALQKNVADAQTFAKTHLATILP
jgi:hypothetical protein